MSQDFWNRFAPTEVSRNRDNPEDYIYYLLMQRALRDFLTRGDRVLDIGGGPGRFALEIAPLVRSVELVDYSESMLELARREAETRGLRNVTFTKADATDLSRYSDGQFDKVLSINTPVSCAAGEWRTALGEMCRVTGRGALFTASNFISCLPRVLEASLEHGIPWNDAPMEMFADHLFDGSKAKAFGIDFFSFRSIEPGELEPELHRLGFQAQEVRGLAILPRLMNPTNVKAVVSDEHLLSSFLDFEWSVATRYVLDNLRAVYVKLNGRYTSHRHLTWHPGNAALA